MPRIRTDGHPAGQCSSSGSVGSGPRVQGEVVILGVGAFGVTARQNGSLRTLALGSCVALILHHRDRALAGMVHVALPDSAINPARAIELPGYFANTGVEALMRAMAKFADDLPAGLTACLVGGANVLKAGSLFNIGEKNVAALRRELSRRRFTTVMEDVGGTISRSVQVDAATGCVLITSPGRGSWEVRL
ncbi:CheD, stimulates methylation of MCP protein [Desulfocurvibacter africanus PCS]|uniref:Probable chemoreceptor glutamine deamidase CheD n=1 Tax=Desulfocurvibacter africanus PCS TaxID=1262666 RepID=M5PT10_DESAF|nr:chemotaxis protein CheD [Desulfocurvibacter africanus]EMG37264.1 CheD, stimulates methylation of MCP protein [Desulfocurvibacter africanus PCS]